MDYFIIYFFILIYKIIVRIYLILELLVIGLLLDDDHRLELMVILYISCRI
jgi:hypothetical protein